MQSLLARLLLASGLAVGLSSATFAGPTSTTVPGTTTTTTTVPGTTTTTTTVPGTTTTTTTVPGTTTTTTTVPTTTTTTTSTTTTSTTTTTIPAGDLSGQHSFLDALKSGLNQDNQSFLDINTSSGQFCLSGLVQGVDAGSLPNRLVTFEYDSLGTIRKADEKRVTGEFVSVDLTLTIEESGSPVFGPRTVTSECTLKGGLLKEGDRSKVRLKCEVGSNLAAFGLSPSTNQGLIDDVGAAFPKQPHIRVDTKTGRIRITQNGEPAPSGVVTLTCP